ncbi:MAG: Gfo/Idh/MocA family oxidoreductase, partial [Bacteroidales bacterium]|nr:Gfo/Idh/MocA family oxidoreductase [Bacteroidales bacterium]
KKWRAKKPLTYSDFRKLLENKDIDAVIIATPDHWHVVMMIMALEAGKHVYVEKPMGHSIEECLLMEKVAAKYPKLAIQVGMWQRSSPHWFDACDFVQSGKLGSVNLVKAWVYKGMDFPVEKKEDSNPPDYADYDMWLGPAPLRPFNENRFHYNFRWYWDYAGGAMTDWGVHLLDFAMLGMKAGYPDTITPGGGIYLHQPGTIETPDIQQAIYNYPTHTMMWECGLSPGMGPYGMDHGIAFIGTRGTLVASRKGWRVVPEKKNEDNTDWIEAVPMQEPKGGLMIM